MSFFLKFKTLYRNLIDVGPILQSALLLAMRLFWGTMFMLGGWGKLQDIASVIGFFERLNIPFPVFNAYNVASVEFLGGLFLMVGFLARIASIPLVIIMVVALLTVNTDAVKSAIENPQGLLSLSPFTFLLTTLIIFAFGPGKYSLDYLLGFEKKGDKDKSLES